MADRLGMRWPAGLAALGAVCLGLGTALEVWSAALFHEADEFGQDFTGAEQLSDEQNRYYASLWQTSSALHEVVSPMVAGGVLAVVGLLAVLAIRWQRREHA